MPPVAGTLSIASRNIFGILRKWLYEEPDTVFRELVSNAADAVVKMRDIAEERGEPGYRGRIDVELDLGAKTLTISDNGLGMTLDEVDRYINQIAFSGAAEFVAQYQENGEIIGRFGVGFYSAFMVADQVTIETRSHRPDEDPVCWTCDSGMEYTMARGDRAEVGTSVGLRLTDDCPYLDDPELGERAIRKYFAFLRTEVFYSVRPEGGAPVPANTPDPVWRRPDATDEEMRAFYREHFDDPCDPLLWLRVQSVDLGLRGIVFLRDTRGGNAELDGRFDVYSRGVFVGRETEGLVPRFVRLQSGIIDCDQLPLVVARSAIRAEEVRELVHECLTQEVAIRMHEMFTTDRAGYERLWPEIGPFVKYGVMTDKTFASVMIRKVVFATIDGGYRTLDEHLAEGTTVYYVSDPVAQAHYVDVFRRAGLPALVLDHVIDQPLLRALELSNRGLRFVRVDSDLEAVLTRDEPAAPETDPPATDVLVAEFRGALADRVADADAALRTLRTDDVPVIMTRDEATRRTGDLMELYGADATAPRTLLINAGNPLITTLLRTRDETRRTTAVRQLVDLALLSEGSLAAEHVPGLLTRSEQVLTSYLLEGENP